MKVIFQNGSIYKLDLTKDISERIKVVEDILQKEVYLIEKYWETNKTKTILDILSTYVFNGDGTVTERNEQEYSVFTSRQIKARNGEIEIPIDYTKSSSENLILTFKEKHKRKGKKAVQKYQNSATHKLTVLKIPLDKRVNKKVEKENSISTHRFFIKDGQLGYSNDMKYRSIDVFTPEDKYLPFIDPSLPYIYSWEMVDENYEFSFNGKQYKINVEYYPFDRVLCYYQKENSFFDPNISQIDDLITTIYN